MDRRIFQVHFCIRIHDSHSHHLIIHFFICINKQCMESQLLASPHTATAIPFPPRRNKPPSAAFALQAITASPPQKTRSPPTPHIPHFSQRAATTPPPSARSHSAQNRPHSQTAPPPPDTCATTDSSPPRATSSSAGVSSPPRSPTESPSAASGEVAHVN